MSSYDKAVILDGELPIGFVQHKMTYRNYVRQAVEWFCDLAKGNHVVDSEELENWYVDADGNIADGGWGRGRSQYYRDDAGCVLIPVRHIPDNFDPDELCYDDLGQEKPEDYPDREAYKAAVQKVLAEHIDDLVMVIHHHY